jgi:hypothetical protein
VAGAIKSAPVRVVCDHDIQCARLSVEYRPVALPMIARVTWTNDPKEGTGSTAPAPEVKRSAKGTGDPGQINFLVAIAVANPAKRLDHAGAFWRRRRAWLWPFPFAALRSDRSSMRTPSATSNFAPRLSDTGDLRRVS